MEMSQDNQITVRGYVTAEPRLWQTAKAHSSVASVRVGSTPRRLNRETGEWGDGETSYYTVKCWRRLAENVHGSLRKGDMIIVRGKVYTRTWLDDQQHTRTEVEIEADSVGHDLSFGWSRFNRGVHVPPGVKRGVDEGEAIRQGMAPDADLPDGAAEFDDYEDIPHNGHRDDGYDDPGAGLAPDGPDGPLSPQDAPHYADRTGSSDEGQAFAELTRDFAEPAEAASAL
jgi:single-strand DNA-binding protein